MNCLAFAITSNNKNHINSSLSFLSLKKDLNFFNIISEKILLRNTQFEKTSFQPSNFETANTNTVIVNKRKYSDSTFNSLMNKIENGLHIKDLKSSEIMHLYEHKIAMLTLKEQELQNYVDVKTQALQEADKIITQYKCRQADAEAEALRLRSMLKDYEYRCEMSAAKSTQEECKRKKLETDLELAYGKIREIEQNAHEQREITLTQVNRLVEQKKNFEEEKLRLSEQIATKDQEKKTLVQQYEEDIKIKNKLIEELQETKDDLCRTLEETRKSADKSKSNFELKQFQLQNLINAAEQSIATLEERNENLMNELAKRSEQFSRKIDDLSEEKELLTEQLKLKDLKIEDMSEGLKKLNDNLHEKSVTIQENEKSLSKFRTNIEQLKNQQKKLEQDRGMLELLCKKYEGSIEEKDSMLEKTTNELEILREEFNKSVSDNNNQILHLKNELDKHKAITEMIHSMTSGRGLPSKT